jgi:hypothetical protein
MGATIDPSPITGGFLASEHYFGKRFLPVK